MSFRLGIDFGTSTTVACLRWPDGRTRPLLFDGSPLLPSAVYLDEDRLLVGRDAVHSARVQPANYEPNPKQRIDDGVVLLGSAEIPVARLIAAVLRRVAAEAATVTGGSGFTVTLAYPAAWGEHRRRTLYEAAVMAGLPQPRMVPEPIAAASYFDAVVRDRSRPSGFLVVYDLGAGTFDVSVIARGAGGFEVRVTDGLADIGGLDIDAAIVGFLGALSPDDLVWARLEQPATSADMRARRQLWDDVRTAKEMLSRAASTLIFVPLVDKDVPLGRAQFERLVRPLLERTVATTRAALRRAALPARTPLDIFLVGGASRVPLIATLLHRALGQAPTAIEQPELAVAEGCLTAVEPPGEPRSGLPIGQVSPGVPAFGQPAPARYAPPPAARPVHGPRPWTELVQVLDLAVGGSAGFTLRCYLPAADPEEEPDAVFLTADRRLLVFDELPDLVTYIRSTDTHDLAGLTDWHVVSSDIDARSAERFSVEAYELDLIIANVTHGFREWSPPLFVAARDLAVELGNALDLRPVLKAFSRSSLLDRLDDAIRLHQGTSRTWWKDWRPASVEVAEVRDTWRHVVDVIEDAVWPQST